MRLRSATLLLVALGLLAAGCSDDKKPQTLPTLTATPSTTATPIVIPSAATVHDAFGAAAFVRFYYDQVNRAYAEGSARQLDGLSDPACSTCLSFENAVADMAEKRQHLDGLAVRLLSAEAPPEENGLVAVDVRADTPPRRLVAADGTVVDVGKAEAPYHLTVYAKRTANGWIIRAVRRLS